jgi:hypothetical protein
VLLIYVAMIQRLSMICDINICRQAVGCHGYTTLIDYVAMITDRYKRRASKGTLPALGYACSFRAAEIQYFKTNAKRFLTWHLKHF